eukprot:jgi/Ulvmu1/6916/UM031_0123.1
MATNIPLRQAIAEVTQPFYTPSRKNGAGLLEAYLADRNQRDDVYVAVLHRARGSLDQLTVVTKCFAFIRKNLLRCPPSLDICEQLLDDTETTQQALGSVSKELQDLIEFVKNLLETFIVTLDEGMGGKGSKHGSDGDSKKAEKARKRRTASDGIPAKVVPPIGLANIEDSPFLTRTTSGADTQRDTQSARSSTSRQGVPYTGPLDRIGTLASGSSPEDEFESFGFNKLSTRISTLASVPEFSLQGEPGGRPGSASALDDLLHQRWQISPAPAPGSEDAARVEAFAAWPQVLAAPGCGLFRSDADAAAAYQTAPLLQARGDYHCTDDSRVCVLLDSEGPQQLRSVAHIQQLQAKQSAPKQRGAAAAAAAAAAGGSPFPNNLRPLFAYKRYAEQEPLNVTPAETAAVVAVVLGREAAAGLLGPEFGALTGADPAALGAGLVPGVPAVQVDRMASILVKVVMDMWLQEDPAETLMLMLPMLTAAMRQPDRTARVRVFDLLYSLSLHAQMIEPVASSDPGGGAAAAAAAAAGAEGRPAASPAHLRRLQPSVRQDSGGGLAVLEAVPANRVVAFLQWLRCLLFEMLLEAVHSGDRSEAVWRAALGCLLHLVASGGAPDLARMAGLSTAPLAALLTVAEDNAWSQELQGVLICMACQLCGMHTENDPLPAAADGDDGPRRPPPLNLGQLSAFGGVPQLLHCMHARPTRRAQRAALSVLLDVACIRACRLNPTLESYLSSSEARRLKALLSSPAATEAIALAATRIDSISDAAAASAAAATAIERHLEAAGRGGHAPSVAAAASLRSVLSALAPAAADADGGVAWAASATHLVDTCLGSDEFARSEAADALGSMTAAPDTVTQRRCGKTLASLFWRGRAAFVSGSIISYLPAFATRRAADVYSISLLSPPPAMPGSAPHSAPSPLAPLLDTLATQLHTPALAPRGQRLLMHTLHVLVATFLTHKGDFGTGSARTAAAHVFVAAATVASGAAWLRRVPDADVALPAMIGIVRLLLDLFAVPVGEATADVVLPVRGVSMALGRGNPGAPAMSPDKDRAAPRDSSLLSAITLFLKGNTSVPSLAVMAMPIELLLTLRDGLAPPGAPDRRAAAAPRVAPGFCGWHTVAGTGATAAAAEAAASAEAAAGASAAGGVPPARDHDVEAETAKGLAFGYASARDARVVVYIILLWKCQLDAAALEAAGGCAELKKVLQDEDARVRLIVAKFIQGRLSRHRKEDFGSALQSLMAMAQTTANGSLLDNPYVQLQAFLSHELLSVDDL